MSSSNSELGRLVAQLRSLHDVLDQALAEVEKEKAEIEKQRQEQSEQFKEERRKWDEEIATMEKIAASASSIINLNVGGTKITTRRATLTLIDGTSLATMFSGRWEDKLPKDADGCIFVDYDPFLFNHLLNQLRTWSTSSVKRVFHLPAGSEELFLEFVRSLNFDDRYIDGGRSIITRAHKPAQSEEEGEQPINSEKGIITSATTAKYPEEKVKPSTADGTTTVTTSATTMEQSKVDLKPPIGGGTTTTSATTVKQPKAEVKLPADDGTTTTSATTAGQTQVDSKSPIDGGTITTSTTTMEQPKQEVEHFRVTNNSDVRLSDNDKRCEKIGQKKDWQCVSGTLDYSTGIHRIRFKIEKGSFDILLGIFSRNKPPTGPCFYDKPTTHGWMVHGYVVKNGASPHPGWSQVNENNILELTINCDEQLLSITNERSGAKNSMQVDINQAPFPWCLLVLLHYEGGRVSLV